MGKEEYDFNKSYDEMMESIESLSESVSSRPATPAWEIASSALDEACKIISSTEEKMTELMQAGKYDDMMEYWKNTVGYRQDSCYAEAESRYSALSAEDKSRVQEKYEQYVQLRENFEDTCRLYENRMKGMRKSGKKSWLIAGPVFIVIMTVVIKGIGWNNLITKFLMLCALAGTVEVLCELGFEKLNVKAPVIQWAIAIVGSLIGVLVWRALIGMPPATFTIILGYIIWAGIAYDIASDSFTLIAGG